MNEDPFSSTQTRFRGLWHRDKDVRARKITQRSSMSCFIPGHDPAHHISDSYSTQRFTARSLRINARMPLMFDPIA